MLLLRAAPFVCPISISLAILADCSYCLNNRDAEEAPLAFARGHPEFENPLDVRDLNHYSPQYLLLKRDSYLNELLGQDVELESLVKRVLSSDRVNAMISNFQTHTESYNERYMRLKSLDEAPPNKGATDAQLAQTAAEILSMRDPLAEGAEKMKTNIKRLTRELQREGQREEAERLRKAAKKW